MLWNQIRIKTPPDTRIPKWLLSGHNNNNNNIVHSSLDTTTVEIVPEAKVLTEATPIVLHKTKARAPTQQEMVNSAFTARF
jgi:hypothetical protein